MNIKEEIYNYLTTNSHSTIDKIANELKIDSFLVLSTINELIEKGCVKMDEPVPLSLSNNNSCYYSCTGKDYCAEDIGEVVE